MARDAAGRRDPGLLLRAGGGRQPQHPDGQSRSTSARATSTSASSRRLEGHVRHGELVRGSRLAGSKDFEKRFKTKFPNELHQPGGRQRLLSPSICTRPVEQAGSRPIRTRCARSSLRATSASTRPPARSASTRRASTCRHRSTCARSTRTIRSTFPKVWDDIKPYWLGEVGCDLTKNESKASTRRATCPRCPACSSAAQAGGADPAAGPGRHSRPCTRTSSWMFDGRLELLLSVRRRVRVPGAVRRSGSRSSSA